MLRLNGKGYEIWRYAVRPVLVEPDELTNGATLDALDAPRRSLVR